MNPQDYSRFLSSMKRMDVFELFLNKYSSIVCDNLIHSRFSSTTNLHDVKRVPKTSTMRYVLYIQQRCVAFLFHLPR